MGSSRFEGRTAVVTGGASGIGLAIVARLVDEGARVAIGDINGDTLGDVRRRFGDAVATLAADVRVEADVEALVALATDRFGGPHLGFNAAGLGAFAPIVEMTESEWDTVVDICLKGMFFSVKHEARAMIAAAGGGAIVNIASLNAHVPMFGGTAYAVSKAGVEMLSRNAALELAPHRIRVNTVSPGLTDTPLTAGMREIDGAVDAFMDRIPLKRWGTPADMAAAALFLASEDAGYISGSNLFVDGAWETSGYPDMSRFANALDETGNEAQ